VRCARTNEIVLYIPKGLYGFKTADVAHNSITVLASRMYFEDENELRIINQDGLDTVLQLNYSEPGKAIPCGHEEENN